MHNSSRQQTQLNGDALRINGRGMAYEEFIPRLQNFCNSLGFHDPAYWGPPFFDGFDAFDAEFLRPGCARDRVIILSCRVPYNPNWGGFRGLPKLLVSGKDHDEQCPAAFIAPFLQQYRFAREHVYLAKTGQGRYLITLPESLVSGKNGEQPGGKLVIALDKVAEPDGEGDFVPVMSSGSMVSYTLSNSFRQLLDGQHFTWKPARSIPVGEHLGSELFSFADVLQAVDRNSPFVPTLLPHLNQIVTHRTPSLRAAAIHLAEDFSRTIAALTGGGRTGGGKVLCLAGLDIDMTGFLGHGEHCFVPWQAYRVISGEPATLEQDDLFVQLMQQEKTLIAAPDLPVLSRSTVSAAPTV